MSELPERLVANFSDEICAISDEEEKQLFEYILSHPGNVLEDTMLVNAARFITNGNLDDLLRAIQFAHRPTQLQAVLFSLLKKRFWRDNEDLLARFVDRFSDCRLLVVHMTCWERLDLAKQSAQTFGEVNGLMNIFLVGRGNVEKEQQAYIYDDDARILSVPEDDNYESLTPKIGSFVYFIGMSELRCAILKADDDVRSHTSFSAEFVQQIANDHQYAGRVNR